MQIRNHEAREKSEETTRNAKAKEKSVLERTRDTKGHSTTPMETARNAKAKEKMCWREHGTQKDIHTFVIVIHLKQTLVKYNINCIHSLLN